MSMINAAMPYISHYGYWAIFFGVLLENFGIPLPGETLIIVGGICAANGTLNILPVILVGIIAAFLGSNIGYTFGYFGGRPLVKKYGRFVFINEQRFKKLEDFVDSHGSKVIILGRFFIGLRQFSGFIVGISKMSWPRFALFNMVGAILWVGSWAGCAYYFKRKFDTVFTGFENFGKYALIGLVTLALFIIVYYLLQKKWKSLSIFLILLLLGINYTVFAQKAESLQSVSIAISNDEEGIGFDDLRFSSKRGIGSNADLATTLKLTLNTQKL